MSTYFTDTWWDEAVCGGQNPDLFASQPTKEALEMCAACPVRQQCAEHVMESPWVPYGIWAGMKQHEVRRQWRERHPRASRAGVQALMGVAG